MSRQEKIVSAVESIDTENLSEVESAQLLPGGLPPEIYLVVGEILGFLTRMEEAWNQNT